MPVTLDEFRARSTAAHRETTAQSYAQRVAVVKQAVVESTLIEGHPEWVPFLQWVTTERDLAEAKLSEIRTRLSDIATPEKDLPSLRLQAAAAVARRDALTEVSVLPATLKQIAKDVGPAA